MEGWTDKLIVRWKARWMDGRTDRKTNIRIIKQTNRWTDGWRGRGADGCIDRWMENQIDKLTKKDTKTASR